MGDFALRIKRLKGEFVAFVAMGFKLDGRHITAIFFGLVAIAAFQVNKAAGRAKYALFVQMAFMAELQIGILLESGFVIQRNLGGGVLAVMKSNERGFEFGVLFPETGHIQRESFRQLMVYLLVAIRA